MCAELHCYTARLRMAEARVTRVTRSEQVQQPPLRAADAAVAAGAGSSTPVLNAGLFLMMCGVSCCIQARALCRQALSQEALRGLGQCLDNNFCASRTWEGSPSRLRSPRLHSRQALDSFCAVQCPILA